MIDPAGPTRHQLGILSIVLGLLAAACSGGDGAPPTEARPRPGFAVEGSVDTSHQVHLYRTTLPPDSGRGLVIRFHPRSGSFRVADDVQPPVDELMVCGHDVGMDGGRLPDSCQLVPIGGSVDIGDGGEAHVAVELVAPGIEPVFVPELVVTYEPADGFLGVEFPG